MLNQSTCKDNKNKINLSELDLAVFDII